MDADAGIDVGVGIDAGIDIEENDNLGLTALHYSVQGDHEKVAKLLLERRANINAADN